MKRNLNLFINDIMEAILSIESFSKKLNRESLSGDDLIQSAIMRKIEIIGDAVKNVPNDFRIKYPEVEWRKIAGLRDIIIHTYFDIDLDVMWEIIKRDFPRLKKQIENILKNLKG